MNKPAIEARKLTKRYRLGAIGARSLREEVEQLWRTVRRSGDTANEERDFWALDEVSFNIEAGQVVGILGRNGAGKSTLLKILSRITEPTSGSAIIRGRVASLLEVGTGFHPELTGRENIYLNGAILGMRRAEISRKLDEVIAFAEIEKFIDTPVKRYSSGMYVRLAFAVAAHLEADVLFVDEVLAVGDAKFQAKCMSRMDAASHAGKTVLFVSHQLESLQALCPRSMVLAKGKVIHEGPTGECINLYLEKTKPVITFAESRHFESAELKSEQGDIFFGDPLDIFIGVKNLTERRGGINVSFGRAGRRICLFSTDPHDGFALPRKGAVRLHFHLPSCRLAPGEYSVDLAFTEPGIQIVESLQEIIGFRVIPRPLGGDLAYTSEYGDYFPEHEWEILEE